MRWMLILFLTLAFTVLVVPQLINLLAAKMFE
jgi:hypothetical protein